MSLEAGVALFDQGHFWEAHEAWEEAWVPDRHGPDRGFYKGLIQVAAGCLHRSRHNRRGALNKLGGGAALLVPYSPEHRGIDVAAVIAFATAAIEAVEAGEWDTPAPPRLGPPRRA